MIIKYFLLLTSMKGNEFQSVEVNSIILQLTNIRKYEFIVSLEEPTG